jgi:hypothetical protein
MANKKITRQLSIFINGKEIKNSLGAIGREIGKVKGKLREANDPKDIIKYKAELKKLRGVYAENNKEINGTTSSLGKMKKILGPIGPMFLATFSITAILAFFKTIASEIGVLRKLKGTISQITDLQGEQLDQVTSKVKAMSDAFESDTKKMTEAANNLSKTMEIDFTTALDLIEQGFLDGADANGDFLDKVREYPALLKEAGFSAEQSIALMTQEIKQGIYSDKGVDAIKEANLRLREMTPAAEEALNAIGLSSKNIQKELTSGSKTTFEIIQKVSQRMATLPPQSKLVGQAIADIFGGPGEDAGIKYLTNLHNIDLSLNSVSTSSNKYTQAKKLEVDANEALNNVWVKLTGTGSSLALLYSSFKLGLANLLGTLTGVKDEALEAKKSFDEQAKSVINLNKNLTPLLDEYDLLKSKSKLSKEEQARLKTIIERISGVVPTAITAFDEYGKAMDISSDKAREFIGTQKALLKYRNTEVIEEETEKLEDLNSELEKINTTLNKRNKAGDIVRIKHNFTKTDKLIISEEKLGGNEIKKLQARAAEIQQIQLGVQASLDEHTGDYLDKFLKSETTKTDKTAEEIEARRVLEEIAGKHRIKNIANLSDNQLQVEIEKSITRNNELAGVRKKASEKAAIERERELEKQQEYRDKVLISGKTLLDKETIDFENRLKQAGIFGREKGKLTASELLVLETLEAQHQTKIAKIELDATNKHLASKKKKYDSEKNVRQIAFNNELVEIDTLDKAKLLLRKNLSVKELSKINTLEDAKKELKRQHEAKELQKQSEYLESIVKLYTTALSTGEIEGVSFADKILTEEQKEVLKGYLEEVKLKLSEVKAAQNGTTDTEGNTVDLSELSNVDIFGFSPEQWENSFAKLDEGASKMDKFKQKIGQLEVVLGGLQKAWGMYSNFVAQNEKKQLQTLEKSNNKKKDSSKAQLDSGVIDQDKYNEEIEKLDNKLAKAKAEIEYKQAKREKTSALFSIASSTALGIMKAVASFPLTGGMPWAAIIGAMGALQAGLVLAAPLPDKSGFYQGGFTGDKAIRYDYQDGVAMDTPNGPYHINEWVSPKWMTESPRYAPTIQYLEKERLKGPGFFDGGLNSSSSTPTPIFEEESSNEASANNETNQMLMSFLIKLDSKLDAGFKGYVVKDYEDFLRQKEIDQEHEDIYKNTRS